MMSLFTERRAHDARREKARLRRAGAERASDEGKRQDKQTTFEPDRVLSCPIKFEPDDVLSPIRAARRE
jgi:hypothetical protein